MTSVWAAVTSKKPGTRFLTAAAVLFVIMALSAMWNIDSRDGIHCGSWLSPNDPLVVITGPDRVVDFEIADKYEVARCERDIESRGSTLIVLGVATLALLVVGVLRRYQPPGGRTTPPSSA